ncbi:DUF1579 family protein [Erythrobacter sp. SD-21]|uniref:DUF1579 family protein n=1 Tax=Erythrobacter sp. SD-21 TaxID=161528 RepID=UPI000A0066A5|nr:DUF1579 family protein [Erythrobacter sp. SD-21]
MQGLERLAATFFAVIFSAAMPADQSIEARSSSDSRTEQYPPALTSEHSALAEQEGEFSLQSRYWSSQEAEPIVTRLNAQRRMVLGNRVLELVVSSDPGSDYPYQGRGLTGFDTSLNKHWYIWMDTTSTGVALLYGSLSQDSTGVLEGSVTNRTQGVETPLRIEIRRQGSREIHEYFSPDEIGNEWRWMELIYDRY